MAHTRQYSNCAYINIDAGQARGYDKKVVIGKPKRFFASAKARLTKGGPPVSDPSEKYLDEVEEQLDEIWSTLPGSNLIGDLNAKKENVVICYPEIQTAITNKCAGTSSATTRSGGTTLFLRPYNEDSPAKQLPVFQLAYNQATHLYNDAQIAAEINAAIDATKLQGGSRFTHVTAQQIGDWMAGNVKLPTKDSPPFAYLLWVFERYLPVGDGNASRIRFDPWNSLSGTDERPPVVGLFHELIHAWHNSTGRKIFSDDDLENEMMTVGLPPFDNVALGGGARPYTENLFRVLIPVLNTRNHL